MALKGATKHCVWGLCKSDSRYPDNLSEGTYFIRFPKLGNVKEGMTHLEKQKEIDKTNKCKRWVHACGRKNFTVKDVKKDTYICSRHFVESSGPTIDNPDPLIAKLGENSIKTRKRKPPKDGTDTNNFKKSRNTENNVSLSLTVRSMENNGFSSILNSRSVNTSSFETKLSINETYKSSTSIDLSNISTPNTTDTDIYKTNIEDDIEFDLVQHMDKSTQTKYEKYCLGAKIETITMRNTLSLWNNSVDNKQKQFENNINPMNPEYILSNKEKCKFFIGLFLEQFDFLFEFLGPAKYQLNYWNSKESSTPKKVVTNQKLTIKEQLFVTLLRLRRGICLYSIAPLYSVSESYVRKIFTTWIMFMYQHFKDYRVLMFPERSLFKNVVPNVFRHFKNIRCSVDCTEFFCEMP